MTSWFALEDLVRLAGFLLVRFAIVFALASIGFALGATLTRRIAFVSPLEKTIATTGLGLALLGHLLLGLGLLNLLTREALAFVLGVLAVLCLHGWREWLRRSGPTTSLRSACRLSGRF